MRSFAAFLPCWFLFLLGTIPGLLADHCRSDYWSDFWFNIFNDCMLGSVSWQAWTEITDSQFWPWELFEDKDG
jgi:hypothetical protein